ncbi:hypothetical protein SDC9_126449 [bioreactor metagenome]|uniref:Uncharacterized protein n=1 Tax=bioreactor metagenome TaxID=1076179 RepID=A0A645CQR4_9ZZZZ
MAADDTLAAKIPKATRQVRSRWFMAPTKRRLYARMMGPSPFFFASSRAIASSEGRSFTDKSGTRVRETRREAKSDMATVRASSLKIFAVMPSIKTMGRKTATVVKVEAVTAMATSSAPFRAASAGGSPSRRIR